MKTKLQFIDTLTNKPSTCADHFDIEFSCSLNTPGILIEKGRSDFFTSHEVATDCFFFSMELKHEFEWNIEVDGQMKTVFSQVEDIWINAPNVSFSHNNNHPAEFLVLTIHPDLMYKYFSGYLPMDQIEFLNDYNVYDERLIHMMKLLLFEAQWSSSGTGFLENWLRLFSNYFIHNYSNIGAIEKHVTQSILSEKHLQVINNFIDEEISRPISIDELANLINLNKFHFLNEFKKFTGQTPYQYLIAYKIEVAKGLLVHTTDTLTNIALSLGFSDSSHFSRTFKTHTHQTPKQFRHSI